MPMSDAERDAIMLADAIRWMEREGITSPTSRAAMPDYHGRQDLLKGVGLVNGTEVRYSPRWKPTQLSAYDRAEMSGVEHIYADGRRVVKSHRDSYKARNSHTRADAIHAKRITAADLAPIGNVE